VTFTSGSAGVSTGALSAAADGRSVAAGAPAISPMGSGFGCSRASSGSAGLAG
jgi:hypothetical protein